MPLQKKRRELRERFSEGENVKIAKESGAMAEAGAATVEVGRSQNHAVILNADAEGNVRLVLRECFDASKLDNAVMANDGKVKDEVGKDNLAIDDGGRHAKRLELRERLKNIHPPAGKDVEMNKRRELRSDPHDCMRKICDSKDNILTKQNPNTFERVVDLNTVRTIDGKIVLD